MNGADFHTQKWSNERKDVHLFLALNIGRVLNDEKVRKVREIRYWENSANACTFEFKRV